jgi:predicted Zn-dependent protease with MMP-like domain
VHAIDREAFEALINEAVAALPRGFRARIENVSFTVEDWANRRDLGLTGTPGGGTLLGVYRGVPLTRRTSGYHLTVPDVIVIFQQPLQQIARDADHLAALVEHTVRHEVAHYFGISDERLRELGSY